MSSITNHRIRMSLIITILAGGDGTRMRSTTPKVLHEYLGTPMLVRIIHECLSLHPSTIFIITGKHHDMIQSVLRTYKLYDSDHICLRQQEQQLGTADAVKTVMHEYKEDDHVLLLNGDTPALHASFLRKIIHNGINTIVTAQIDNPHGYGRIVTKNDNHIVIVEEKDCNEAEKAIHVINTGIYYVHGKTLKTCLPQIKNDNASREYYLTDMVSVAYENAYIFQTYPIHENDKKCILGVNTPEQLWDLETY